MTTRELEKIELAKLIGYKYVEEGVTIEFEDWQHDCIILSKVPIEVVVHENIYNKEQMADWVKPFETYIEKYFAEVPNPDYMKESGRWAPGRTTMDWDIVHMDQFMLLKNWNPDTDFNQIIEVIRVIKGKTDEIFDISTNCELNFQKCLAFARCYEK